MNKSNLLIMFCHNYCKFHGDGCENMMQINDSYYCPAEHFSHWLSERLRIL